MSNLSSFLGPPYLSSTIRPFTSSGSFTPSRNLLAMVTVVGGGGSGAVLPFNATGTILDNGIWHALGGNAGAFSQSLLRLKSGVTYTITVGAGGASVNSITSGVGANGNAGTSSVFTGDGTTMTAPGGAGGTYYNLATYVNSTTYTTNPAAAAVATGGQVNHDGGKGGVAESYHTVANRGGVIATGGGAVNCYGLAVADVSGGKGGLNNPTGPERRESTGGGGLGGRRSIKKTTAGDYFSGGGGGAGGAGTDNNWIQGGGLEGAQNDLIKVYLPAGAGGYGNGGGAAGAGYPGGGGGGSNSASAGAGGVFGGGGATCCTSGTVYGGNGGWGGGGGASSCIAGTVTSTSGAGGQGIVFIDFIPI